MKNKDKIDGLIAKLNDKDWEIRSDAASTLSSFGSEDPSQVAEFGGIDALIDALDDDDWVVRYEATRGLGRIGESDPKVLAATGGVGALKNTLQDERRDVRWAAVESLQRIGIVNPVLVRNVNGIEALVRTVNDDNQKVRRKGVTALGTIGARAQDALVETDAPHILRGLLDNQDDVLRALSATALLGIDPEMPTTQQEKLRQIVRNHLVEQNDPIWVVKLLRNITNSYPVIVEPFEEELRTIKDTSQGRLRRSADETLRGYE